MQEDEGPRQDEWEYYEHWLEMRDAVLVQFGDYQDSGLEHIQEYNQQNYRGYEHE